ncbi:MAG: DUF935 family protein [Rhodobacteraceae bacterium]|nr:DUF935 family protein [Paracoccaceae bacterium]
MLLSAQLSALCGQSLPGSGKEHREVQGEIETTDAQDLGAILNRDLIIPWMQLEFGPQKTYPGLVIARPRPKT